MQSDCHCLCVALVRRYSEGILYASGSDDGSDGSDVPYLNSH